MSIHYKKYKYFDIETLEHRIRLYAAPDYRHYYPYVLDFSKVKDQNKFFSELKDISNDFYIICSPNYNYHMRSLVAEIFFDEENFDTYYSLTIIHVNDDFFKNLYTNDINLDLEPFKAFNDVYKLLSDEIKLKAELK